MATSYDTIFEKHGLIRGRMLGSKSRYALTHPINVVIFNANIAIVLNESHQHIWRGDIDVTKDYHKLKSISDEISATLYISSEVDPKSTDPIWNSTEKKITLPDIFPERKMQYDAKAYKIKRTSPYGYSAFNTRKVNEIIAERSGLNRFCHANNGQFENSTFIEQIYCMQDRNNYKTLSQHRTRNRNAANPFKSIKGGNESLFSDKYIKILFGHYTQRPLSWYITNLHKRPKQLELIG